MIWAWAFFRRSLFAQIVAGVAAFLAIWAANNAIVSHNASKTERKRIADNTKQVGRKKNAQSKKIRKKVQVPGSFERLLDQHCRDCN